MTIPQPPPKKTLEDWWNDFQADLKAKMYQFGLSRQQQTGQGNPVNQWNPSQQNLTPDMMRPWLGDKAVNDMTNLSNWYQQKIVPIWQQLANFDKSLQRRK